MRNFKGLWKGLLCIGLLVLLLKGLDILLYPCTFVRNDIHAVTTEKQDLIILGTSNGKMNLDPDALLADTDLTGHNLCVGGEYPIDAYYLTKLLVETKKPDIILYETEPVYFTTEKEKGNNYMLFYHEFPLSKAKMEYFWGAMTDCDFRTILFPFYEYPLTTTFPRVKSNLTQKLTGSYDATQFKGTVQEYHENGFIEKYPVAVEDFSSYTPTLFSAEEVYEENIIYLQKLIALCKEEGITFIACTSPLPGEVLQAYPEAYSEAWDYFTAFYEEQGVPYYNFNREYYIAYPHDTANYVDFGGHMNGDSARNYSAVLGEIIAELQSYEQ